jgi:biopolymer transport protein ExbD
VRHRRLKKTAAHLEVTAFINLIVVLVPFLLSTAVFTRLSVVELKLPEASSAIETLKVNQLKLEVIIRPDAIDVGDRLGGLIQRIPHPVTGTGGGSVDTAALSTLIVSIKQRFPLETAATILAQQDTPYDQLIQVMDAVREHVQVQGPKVTHHELFPDLSVGDAPASAATRAATPAAAPRAAGSKAPGV